MTIAAQIFDVVAAAGLSGVHMLTIIAELHHIDPSSVESAVHRLRDDGKVVAKSSTGMTLYCLAIGATRPKDRRGRPKK